METKRHPIISRALIIPRISIYLPYHMDTFQIKVVLCFGKADMVIIIKHLDKAHSKMNNHKYHLFEVVFKPGVRQGLKFKNNGARQV